MKDKELFAKILDIHHPWIVREVALHLEEGEVIVYVHWDPLVGLTCPRCKADVPGYDTRERSWRHLNTCEYRTILVAEVPRCNCSTDGVHQIPVPWGEAGSRFTAKFEAFAIDWLKETSISAVGRNLSLSWDQLDGIMQRAVKRGLERRGAVYPENIGVDETSFRKRHNYVTVVQDQATSNVLFIGDDRTKNTLDEYYESLKETAKDGDPPLSEGMVNKHLTKIKSISMDMSIAYIQSTLEHVPDARHKIAFDRFHIAQYLGKAVDKVRSQEHKELSKEKNDTLKGTKFVWLQNPKNMKPATRASLAELRDSALRTARAWAIKEFAASLWVYVSRTWAEKAWRRWLSWALRCRLIPMVKAAKTIRNHLWGILNAIILGVTNAGSESLNAKIQKLKKWACGYRNKKRFKTAIMFHFGGLDLYPPGIERL